MLPSWSSYLSGASFDWKRFRFSSSIRKKKERDRYYHGDEGDCRQEAYFLPRNPGRRCPSTISHMGSRLTFPTFCVSKRWGTPSSSSFGSNIEDQFLLHFQSFLGEYTQNSLIFLSGKSVIICKFFSLSLKGKYLMMVNIAVIGTLLVRVLNLDTSCSFSCWDSSTFWNL